MLSKTEYQKTQEYLESFINYERKVNFSYKKSLKLKRVKFLLECLDIPYSTLRAIHIAGTKGKGSVAHFCANLLSSWGFKVGLYTSPHFFDFRERIKIVNNQRSTVNGRLISKADVARIVKGMKPMLEELRLNKKLGKLTFFEVYTALAFKYFLERKVDFAVLETGLGGRLDATNVVTPMLSLITHIGYDHMDKLGNKLKEIAKEKAGIIKPGIAVVTSFQRPSALKVIKQRCKERKAKLYLLGRDFFAENIRLKRNYTLFDFSFNPLKLKNLKINLKGPAQVENAACALGAVSLLKGALARGKINPAPLESYPLTGPVRNIKDSALKSKISNGVNKKRIREKDSYIRDGLFNTSLWARFEIVKRAPLIIMDIAHNPSSFSALSENLRIYFPKKKIIFIFAASRDKNVKAMSKQIPAKTIILTSFSNPRSFDPWEIKKICKLRDVSIAKNVKDALGIAKKIYKNDQLILISGSIFLVSEAKQLLNKISWENLG